VAEESKAKLCQAVEGHQGDQKAKQTKTKEIELTESITKGTK
jgi:hypothetical protein